jgi:hypothetical protein
MNSIASLKGNCSGLGRSYTSPEIGDLQLIERRLGIDTGLSSK